MLVRLSNILKFIVITIFAAVFLTAVAFASANRGTQTGISEPEILTVADAVKYAAERSTELKNLDENEYLNELNRAALERSRIESYNEGQHVNALVSIMQNELRQASFSDNITLQRLIIEFSVTRYFAAIIAVERDLSLYDRNLALSKANLDIAEVRMELGMMSKNAFDSLKLTYDKDTANREGKVIAADNAYRALNGVMGKELSKRYILEMDIEYEPLGDTDLTRYILSSVKENVAIKNRENDLTLAKYRLELANGEKETEEREIGASQAMRALDDAKKDFEDKIISCYKDIQNLEMQYSAAVNEYTDMLSQLSVMETQFELGGLTRLDIDMYEYQMAMLEYRILSLINDHYIKKMQFMNPDLL